MRNKNTGWRLPLAAAGLGGAALVLRRLLYAVGMDAKNLLVRWHPLAIALLVLTVGTLACIALTVRKRKGSERYEDNFTPGFPGALGQLAMAGGILVTVLTSRPMMAGYLGQAWELLGLAAPVCLLLAAAARALGKKPFFLLHVIPCLFLVIHIVNHYQLWSGNPQMQDYVFTLLGTMALMLFGFYTAAFEADWGNRRMVLGMGLAAIYLCLAELARSSYPALYLGGLVWAATGLCRVPGVRVPKVKG